MVLLRFHDRPRDDGGDVEDSTSAGDDSVCDLVDGVCSVLLLALQRNPPPSAPSAQLSEQDLTLLGVAQHTLYRAAAVRVERCR
jgi:hypothetical protein